VSNQVQGRPAGMASTKAERRAAAKAAAARAAAAKRRRNALVGALAGLAVIAVLIGAAVAFGGSDDNRAADPASSAAPTAASPASGSLPAGMDPALATKPQVTAGSGQLTELSVQPLIEGTGAPAQAGQRVTVNYVGVTYATGEEFDASWNRGQPFSFQLGNGDVIKGWDRGLVGVKVGSRVQLDLPADLAYGENPSNGAPGGALRFVVDVLAAE
jgi:peptidylprolyl isomerase